MRARLAARAAALLAFLAGLSGLAHGHTVDLGWQEVPNSGECLVSTYQQNNAYQRALPQVSATPGRSQVSAILQPRPDRPGMDVSKMDDCTKQAGVGFNGTDSEVEEALRSAVNKCLVQRGANYEVQYVVLRRGPVVCGR